MSNAIDPFLGLIGIAIPIGVAYVILLLQSRKPCSDHLKTSASACNELLQERTEESSAEENRAEP